ncbi:MAG: bifunctional phosphoribosylaminoimidazolecarboxamide formyltransferase/IMP cyclohydrolase [Alphaproteobacteria bacterium]|nr:bifunctional phosphoribosylaminoimidazolecarboxamide formyltransferase/IMP cyclohydrolase [Alphaproteobacteria bacterium]
MPQDVRRIERALLSVSDKTGLVEFAKALSAAGVALVSTGGTAAALRAAGLTVADVSEITEFPEMMDGRVKTLHPRIHGGLLARRDDEGHQKSAAAHAIPMIDLLVVNLYPFEETVARGAGEEETIENIDIGGPALIRGAAKNHDDVAVITDPADYEEVLAELRATGGTTLSFRKRLAGKAYARTAAYDAAIAGWFAKRAAETADETDWPPATAWGGRLRQSLRYGENPHQRAAFYVTGERRFGVATAEQVQGKELSYNNLNDTDAAFELAAEFDPAHHAACAIIKHANPCGVALGDTLADAYRRALSCDPVSAFGGIIALNRALDGETAEEIAKIFTEVIIAPDADADARKILSTKKNLRLLLAGGLPDATAPGLTVKSVAGGFLAQSRDNGRVTPERLKVVTKRTPSEKERADLLFAFIVAKHVKSNAIVYAQDLVTAGIGAGQMSRIDSAKIAAEKAKDAASAAGWPEPKTKGSCVASDAFFPFADGLLAAANAGATAVIQPGGSVRDDEVIAAADEAGLALVFTGMRHFRH